MAGYTLSGGYDLDSKDLAMAGITGVRQGSLDFSAHVGCISGKVAGRIDEPAS
ncbi:hypothetical protein [Breoghania sp. L-A4]|uniref:hypothetical protein n=1 Tax=Breoghania sp. L-A4 TaxID=2304600 RepID=UPI0013C2DCF4|nr:hypothetical protein [Breoghania sp. L-A4]